MVGGIAQGWQGGMIVDVVVVAGEDVLWF